jgi:hypothetical protein
MFAKFPFVGPERGHDAIKKIETLNSDANKTTKETITWLYSVLNILDGKANGLLRVNSLFITLLVFFGERRVLPEILSTSPMNKRRLRSWLCCCL